MLIELSGVGQAATAGLAGLPGVWSVRVDGQRVLVSVEPAASDAVLRALLDGGDAVHVRSVRSVPSAGEASP